MREAGLEPARCYPLEPKSSASTNSAILASRRQSRSFLLEEEFVEGKRAVVLLSGGLDSATVAALAKHAGFAIYALSFDYGQRHRSELAAAARVAAHVGAADHRTVRLDLRAIGGSALTDDAVAVPKDALGATGIPVTYVP